MAGWVLDPDSGGVKIPDAVQQEVNRRLTKHAEKHYAGTYTKLVIRFRGQFCYIDAHLSGEDFPTHLCRLRHFGGNRWSLGFYTYSNEKYELRWEGRSGGLHSATRTLRLQGSPRCASKHCRGPKLPRKVGSLHR